MQTKREFLVSRGLAKEGRGKFSKVANQALDEARAKGVKFSDDEGKVKTVTKVDTDTGEVKIEKRLDPRDTPWIAPEDMRFPIAEYEAVGQRDGKRVVYSMRECCGNCRVSLVNHECDSPTVLGSPVKIRVKK